MVYRSLGVWYVREVVSRQQRISRKKKARVKKAWLGLLEPRALSKVHAKVLLKS